MRVTTTTIEVTTLRKDGQPDRRAGRTIRAGAHGWRRERQTWRDMKRRCLNPKSEWFLGYGGRGITVDPSWLSFDQFYADMGPCPPGLTLERVNNNLGYSPGNCVWASQAAQKLNFRGNVLVTLNDITQPFKAWVTELGLDYRCVQSRVYRGMTHADALTKPWRKSRLERSDA